MARSATEDPIKVFRYRVIVQGFLRYGFSECSALEAETEKVEYREGGNNETPQKSAGLTKFTDITFKRGQVVPAQGDSDFINWHNQVHSASVLGNDTAYRKDIVYEQYDATNTCVRRWGVDHAWPIKFKGMSDFNALGSENSIEELTITHEGFYPMM